MEQTKRNSPHILAYIMEIDKAVRNGEYPNANKMNKKHKVFLFVPGHKYYNSLR